MKPNAVLLSALLVLLAFAGQARAQEPPAVDAATAHPVTTLPQPITSEQPVDSVLLMTEEQPPMVHSWYGWQTLIADGTAALLGAVAVPFAGEFEQVAGAVGVAAVGTYVLAAPVVHFVHGNVGRGFGSLALRATLPVVFGFVGGKAESCSEGQWFCGLAGAAVGATIGVVSAAIIDGAVLAHETVPARSKDTVPNVGFMFDGKQAAVTLRGAF
jgi:hypothetical protein